MRLESIRQPEIMGYSMFYQCGMGYIFYCTTRLLEGSSNVHFKICNRLSMDIKTIQPSLYSIP